MIRSVLTAQAIGRRCCVEGYSVRYTTSAELLEDLIRASGERRLPNRVRYYRTSYLGDPPLAMALLDRVVDGAIVQKFKGKSYRDYRSQHKNGKPGEPQKGHSGEPEKRP